MAQPKKDLYTSGTGHQPGTSLNTPELIKRNATVSSEAEALTLQDFSGLSSGFFFHPLLMLTSVKETVKTVDHFML